MTTPRTKSQPRSFAVAGKPTPIELLAALHQPMRDVAQDEDTDFADDAGPDVELEAWGDDRD